MNSPTEWLCVDGNEAVADVAYDCSEICAIYPITPSSPMAELADQWATEGRPNLWGAPPLIAEMQSEGGAAGAVHGALQTGALATTFTASQGLLLMIPNMYKIAGELSPAVFHVAARSLATSSLSIFGDHSDVMACRATGFAMLAAASVQEAHDFALIAHAATLQTRVPFIHFFDGFRTSHEVNKIARIPRSLIRELISDDQVMAHRKRGLSPAHPCVRGTAANPDTYFQTREAVNPYTDAVPGAVTALFEAFAEATGRRYSLFEYTGHPEAERVVVAMGSGGQVAAETARVLSEKGEKVGALQVRLYRPLDMRALVEALPETVRAVAVLDRTKEPGATGEPLFLDILAALAEHRTPLPRVTGGRYGLSCKEFTPAMVKAVLDDLAGEAPRPRFTVGINDDVTGLSLPVDPGFRIESPSTVRALFHGLGADGTVGANKNTIKIIGKGTDLHAQGYFVYDSKKSGSRTVSHLRFGPDPIRAPWLIDSASFIACHQFAFVRKVDLLEAAEDGAVLLLNSPHGPDRVCEHLPAELVNELKRRRIRLFVINAMKVAREAGLGPRINTVMQTCFFAISGVLPRDAAIAAIKKAIDQSYRRKGKEVVEKNWAAVDATLDHLLEVSLDATSEGGEQMLPVVPPEAPEFVQQVIAPMLAGHGDRLPVSALPADGTWPSGTTRWEKRDIATEVPVWEPDLCIQCGNCAFVCPHGCIRATFFDKDRLNGDGATLPHAKLRGRGHPRQVYTLHVDTEDCTGCALCVDVCPVKDPAESKRKAINLHQNDPERAAVSRENRMTFDRIRTHAGGQRDRIDYSSVRGVQYLEPLFEYSGACAGCGETPYLKLLTQLFGDRMVVANATGCSSIYGGNLPTTPWSRNSSGRGPAWSNSLFEDNAEFGYGFRLTAEHHHSNAERLLKELAPEVGSDLAAEILAAPQGSERELHLQQERVARLQDRLREMTGTSAALLASIADHLVRRSVWIIGGDGWAYDIGYGGLDHVMASGRDVNILVMDTEVYSNTGGQASKSTPLGASAKFAAGGKTTGKKDLAAMAMAYGNVYVARIAMGASRPQTLKAIREAEAFPGPSLILAYSHCIAHGIAMEQGLHQQKSAVACGHWPLFRYNPQLRESGENPFELDTPAPTMSFRDYALKEVRYRVLQHLNPERAEDLMTRAQRDVTRRWDIVRNLAAVDQPRKDAR